jgi:hypothetical protein
VGVKGFGEPCAGVHGFCRGLETRTGSGCLVLAGFDWWLVLTGVVE